MTIEGLEGEGSRMQLSMDWEEEVATFHVEAGTNDPGTVVYDYSNVRRERSLGGCARFRTGPRRPGHWSPAGSELIFHPRMAVASGHKCGDAALELTGFPVPLADRSILGTTINILCSNIPIYWA